MAGMRDGLVKRGSKWCFVVRVPDPATGKTHQEWHSGYRTKVEAKRARDEARAAAGKGTFTGRSELRVAEYMDRWLKGHKATLKPASAASYMQVIDSYVKPRLGGMRVQQLSPQIVTSWCAGLIKNGGRGGRPLSPRTAQYARTVLRKGMADAVVDRIITTNPVTGSKTATVPKAAQTTWTPEQQRIFLDATQQDRWWIFWVMALGTGMRRGELCALRWDRVDLDAGIVTVSRNLVLVGGHNVEGSPKNGDSRVISLGAEIVGALRAHRKQQAAEQLAAGPAWCGDGHVFAWEDGSPVLPNFITKRFASAQHGLGLPRIHLHELRHSHATSLLRAGVPVTVVSKRLGHRDVSVTMNVYSDALPQDDQQAADTLSKLIWGA